MRRARPETAWLDATTEQVDDLRSWVVDRQSLDLSEAFMRWVRGAIAGTASRVSRRRETQFRALLERYGPPRPTGASPAANSPLRLIDLTASSRTETDEPGRGA